jgi:hypothetical protein
MGSAPNREYKAGLFASLFGEPERAIELYNALSGTNFPPDAKVEMATLEDVLFRDRINDLAFIIEGRLVILVEHQSTINMNMPLRFLIYLGRVYEKIMESYILYRTKLVKIPTPEFIVLYNGLGDAPERETLRLSDAFMDAPEIKFNAKLPLELEVSVFNINEGMNAEIVRRCGTLDG